MPNETTSVISPTRLYISSIVLTCARGIYDDEVADHAVALVLGLARGGQAQLDPGNKAFFGLVGIAPGQTLRLAAVNAGFIEPPDPDQICRVRLGFANLDGQPLAERTELRLLPGAGGVLDLPRAAAGGRGRG